VGSVFGHNGPIKDWPQGIQRAWKYRHAYPVEWSQGIAEMNEIL